MLALVTGADADGGALLAGQAEDAALSRALPRWRDRLGEVPSTARLAAWRDSGLRLVMPGDAEWPTQLDGLGDGRPLVLWLRGVADLRLSCVNSVAVVGSRAATGYGSHVAVEMAKARVTDNDDGIVLDHVLEQCNPAGAPQLVPAIGRVIARTGRRPRTVTAGRGYGEKGVDDAVHAIGVRYVVIPREGKPGKARQHAEHSRAFRRTVKWRTGSEGRISTLKRGYGWDRTELDNLQGAPDLDRTRDPGPQTWSRSPIWPPERTVIHRNSGDPTPHPVPISARRAFRSK